jgi:hypothetical protein
MHNPPPELIDLLFQGKFKRGAIIRFNMECDDPARDFRFKFGVILNKNITEDDALLAITTSNLQPFASGYLEGDILRIDVGSYPCFDKPTILSLREVKPKSVAELKILCQNKQMTFEGDLLAEDMAQVEQKILHSKLIEGKYKKRIL